MAKIITAGIRSGRITMKMVEISVGNRRPPISEVNTSIDSGGKDPLIRRTTKRKD
jgi:hypothetical protein